MGSVCTDYVENSVFSNITRAPWYGGSIFKSLALPLFLTSFGLTKGKISFFQKKSNLGRGAGQITKIAGFGPKISKKCHFLSVS